MSNLIEKIKVVQFSPCKKDYIFKISRQYFQLCWKFLSAPAEVSKLKTFWCISNMYSVNYAAGFGWPVTAQTPDQSFISISILILDTDKNSFEWKQFTASSPSPRPAPQPRQAFNGKGCKGERKRIRKMDFSYCQQVSLVKTVVKLLLSSICDDDNKK